jgi:hypothetical protein
MDPRDITLIKQFGQRHTMYLHQLAADPKWDLLSQIKYSDQILSIRQRSHFRQKTVFTKQSEIS